MASSQADVRMDETPLAASPAPSPSPSSLQTPVRSRRASAAPSSLPPTTPMTPNRIRARDERLLRRGQVIATEYSRRRKKYEFQLLPDSGHGTASNESPREMSPARYSPEEVTDAVMSFADFLYFLEEKQREHPLMPTIIARFSELGAVIESQKRHIDLWKSKELDLAISEAQQNFELIRELGLQLEQTEIKLAEERVQKQMWEEKYKQAVLEANSAEHRAQDEMNQLSGKIHELQFQKQELEGGVRSRDERISSLTKDLEELRKTAQQMDKLGSTMSYEKRSLAEQCERQEQTLRTLQDQIQQLQQHCEAERKRAEELNNAAHSWEIKYQEERRLREHLEGDLTLARNERDEQAAGIKRLLGEGGKYRAEFEASAVKLEHQVLALREKLESKDSEIAALLDKLKVESERVQKQNQDMKNLRKQAEEGIVAIKADLEQSFVSQVTRLREEQSEETQRVRAENDELQQRCQHLQQLNQKKSNQIAELMSAQQDWVGEGNDRLSKLSAAVGEWQAKCEQLQQEIRDREKASAEALRKQGADIQEQFNSHVQEMEAYLERKNGENDQLRAAVKSREEELIKLREEAHSQLSKWQSECQELSSKTNSLEFECAALRREIEHRNKALELREKELNTLKQQVEAYLAPDNERTKQTELLHRERLRLEEQNRHLQRQMEDMKKDFDSKFHEINSTYHRATEQESAQRATIVSLHHEKDDMQRALSEMSGEKVALEGHLQGMMEEKEILLDSLSQFEKQNGDLEEKGSQLLHALNEAEKEKTDLLQALETIRLEKTEVENKVARLREEIDQHEHRQILNGEQGMREQAETLSEKLQRREAELADLQQQARQLYDSSRTAEEKCARAENVLREREDELRKVKLQAQGADERARSLDVKQTQLTQEVAQLREWNERYKKEISSLSTQAGERNVLETRYQQLTSELAQFKSWNDRYKKEIESLKLQAEDRERRRRTESEARESELMRQGRGLEAQYEKVKGELASLQISAEQEVRRLQIALDNQKSEFQLEHQRLVATNERLERQARGSGEEFATLKSDLSRVRDELTQASGELEFHRSVLKQREEDLKRIAREKGEAEASLEQYRGQLQRVERAFDDFKRQTMRNVKDKKDAIDTLETENRELRSKLAEQTELKEQALQFAQGDKNTMNADLMRKEQHLTEARARLRHLEEQVKSLQRELKAREDEVKNTTDQEKRRRIIVEKERDELRAQVKMMQAEKEELRAELSSSTDEVAALKRELHELHSAQSSNARLNSKHAKSEMSSRVDSLELELHQAQTALVNERERTKKLRDTLKQERQDFQIEISEKATEVDTLRSKLQKVSADADRKDRVHAERIEDLRSNETNLIKRLKLVQQRCDATASRESELQKELSELVNRTGEEREKLLDELQQTQAVNEVLQGDWSLHEGVRELKNRLVDEQKLVRQHALTIERKESQIRELEARIRRLESRIRELEMSTIHSKPGAEEDIEHELEEMSAKLSKLTMENQRLRDHEHREKVALLESSRVMKNELQVRCSKLKDEIKVLRDENENLRLQNEHQQEDYSASLAKLKKRGTDHTKCNYQIERLTALLEEKESALTKISDHQDEDHAIRRKEATPTSSSSLSPSRRVRELERALSDKEKKILMLNDHLTYLMTSTIELQHENETILALQQHGHRHASEVP